MSDVFLDMYKQFPNERFFGMYEVLGKPTYVIRDPELMKQITIKDFDHFVNHRTQIDVAHEPLMGRSMFMARDQHWRQLRSLISPAFTGSKMRLMLTLVGECTQGFMAHLERDLAGQSRVIDVLDVARRYTSDTIATAAFGLEVNSLENPDNEFYKMGNSVSDFNGVQGLKFLGYSGFPGLMKLLRIPFFNTKQSKFIRSLVHDTIAHREQSKLRRNDMIDLLIEAKNGHLFHNADEPEAGADMGFATVEESHIGKDNMTDHGEYIM